MRVLSIAALLIFLVGCGGGGGGRATSQASFDGHWLGGWSHSGASGDIDVVIDGATVSGNIEHLGDIGSFSATIQPNGNIVGSYNFSGAISNFFGDWNLTDGDMHLGGDVLVDNIVTSTFSMTKQ